MENKMATPDTREGEKTVSSWCPKCGRMLGIGCACGLSFQEKMKSTTMVLPGNFRAVKN